MKAWHELSGTKEERGSLAVGLALGTFIANTPLYGLHTLISLYVGRRLSVHPLSVVIGSHLSTPPVGPLLIALAIAVGHLMLHGDFTGFPEIDGGLDSFWNASGQILLEWTLGSLVVGTLCMVITFFLANKLLKYVPESADAEPEDDG